MRTQMNGKWVEGTPQEIAELLKIKENENNQKNTRCSCYEEDPTGYATTYHRVRSGCAECRNK